MKRLTGSSIFALLLLFILAQPSPATGEPDGGDATLAGLMEQYDSGRCRECHAVQYEQWAVSQHAISLAGLDGFLFMSKYLEKGPLAVAPGAEATLANFPCAKCHLPQLFSAGDAAAAGLARAIRRKDKTVPDRLNIGCLVCHRDKAVAHHLPAPDRLYGGREVEGHEGGFARVEKSPFMASAAFCGQCHGLGPNFEFTPPVQCATLYGSYLHAYIANGGTQTCVDCHMPDKDHTFPPVFSDQKDAARRYQEALPLRVEVLPQVFQPDVKDYRPLILVEAVITNNAGHRLPDG